MNKIKILVVLSICLVPALVTAAESRMRFNVGGHKFEIDKDNERLKQSITLQNPTESPFYRLIDKDGYHFFNLCTEEGIILEQYLHKGTLKKSEKAILKETGEHFGLKEFPQLIAQAYAVKLWDTPVCPLCRKNTMRTLFYATKHMVEEHDATVHGGFSEKHDWFNDYVAIYYSSTEQPQGDCD